MDDNKTDNTNQEKVKKIITFIKEGKEPKPGVKLSQEGHDRLRELGIPDLSLGSPEGSGNKKG